MTCSDEGLPARVIEVGASGLARCADERGAECTVDITLVEPVAPGDSILVHAGVALALVEAGEPK